MPGSRILPVLRYEISVSVKRIYICGKRQCQHICSESIYKRSRLFLGSAMRLFYEDIFLAFAFYSFSDD